MIIKNFFFQSFIGITATIMASMTIGLCTANADTPAITPGTPASPNYVQAIIPHPSTLPGPSGGAPGTTDINPNRRILTQGVLPKLAITLIGGTASLALLFLIIAGVRFVTMYGNPEAAETAKKQVIYALVGLFIALMSYTIVTIISNFNYGENLNPTSTTTTP